MTSHYRSPRSLDQLSGVYEGMGTVESGCHAVWGRQRDNIEERGGVLWVRLYAETYPVTCRHIYHRATIQGTVEAGLKRAEDTLAEFRTRVLNQRSAASACPFVRHR